MTVATIVTSSARYANSSTNISGKIDPGMFDLAMHLIAAHHGRGRPHFPTGGFDPAAITFGSIHTEVIRRFARLQRKYGWWRLAWLEDLLRCADALTGAIQTAVSVLQDCMDRRMAFRLAIVVAGMFLADDRRTASSWFVAGGVQDDWDRFYDCLISVGRTSGNLATAVLGLVAEKLVPELTELHRVGDGRHADFPLRPPRGRGRRPSQPDGRTGRR